MTVKYWAGRTPPDEYYAAPNPYVSPKNSRIDLHALAQYSRDTGKPVPEMTYEEIEQFSTNP